MKFSIARLIHHRATTSRDKYMNSECHLNQKSSSLSFRRWFSLHFTKEFDPNHIYLFLRWGSLKSRPHVKASFASYLLKKCCQGKSLLEWGRGVGSRKKARQIQCDWLVAWRALWSLLPHSRIVRSAERQRIWAFVHTLQGRGQKGYRFTGSFISTHAHYPSVSGASNYQCNKQDLGDGVLRASKITPQR